MPLNTEGLNPLVKAALEAMNAHDRQGWLSLFAPDAKLSDDGEAHDLIEWADRDLFGKDKAYLMSVDRVEDGGLTFYGRLHSDRWGEFETFMKFQISGGKITRLDVGQA